VSFIFFQLPKETGKVTLANYFISKSFIETSTEKQREFENIVILRGKEFLLNLTILESNGDSKFSDNEKIKIHNADGFLAIFDISQKNSFEVMVSYINQIQWIWDSYQLPLIVVGNKCDLKDDENFLFLEEVQKRLDVAEVSSPFFEVSAKNGMNVEMVFTTMLECSVDFKDFQMIPKRKRNKLCKMM
jgi:small GTP-binding protein